MDAMALLLSRLHSRSPSHFASSFRPSQSDWPQGPLLSYETFTAFALEASFFGVLLFGRSRVPPWFYLFLTAMAALGTTLSAFWIMVNNSWMQVPVGYVVQNGAFVPDEWSEIVLNSVVWVRIPHMMVAAYLTGAFCVAATGAWYLLRNEYHAEAHIMLDMGVFLAAMLVPIQIFFGRGTLRHRIVSRLFTSWRLLAGHEM